MLGSGVGLVASILLTVLGYPAPLFPLDPPTLVAMPLSFITCVGVSLADSSRQAAQDRAGFDEQNN